MRQMNSSQFPCLNGKTRLPSGWVSSKSLVATTVKFGRTNWSNIQWWIHKQSYMWHIYDVNQSYDFIYTHWLHINGKTHMVIIVTLPRRNDPFLELLLVGDCRGEELLQRWNRPSQITILHVKWLRPHIHTHSQWDQNWLVTPKSIGNFNGSWLGIRQRRHLCSKWVPAVSHSSGGILIPAKMAQLAKS